MRNLLRNAGVVLLLAWASASNASPGEGGAIAFRFGICLGEASQPFSVDQRLGACNAAIESKEYQGHELADLYLNRSSILNEKGEAAAAQSDVAEALKAWPSIVEAVVARAKSYIRQDKYDLALADLEKAADNSPNAYLVHFDLAKTHLGRHELDPARKEIAIAAALRPDGANTLVLQAQIEAATGNFDGALSGLDRAIALSPESGLAYNLRCYVRAIAGRDLADKALADCNRAHALLPHSPDVLDSRGLVYLQLGRFAEAIADYNAAVAMAQTPPPASLYGRALAEQKTGEKISAEADLAAAESLSPGIEKKFGTAAMMLE